MPNRASSTQPRPTVNPAPRPPARPTVNPAPRPPTATQTGTAGWNAGASAAKGLRIQSAKIDDGLATTDRLSLPTGYKAQLTPITNRQKDTVHGKEVTLEQYDVKATITTPKGKTYELGSTAGTTQTAADWKAEVKAAKKEPANEYTQLSWDSQRSVRGAGTAGKLISVSEGGSSYTGGAHPNNGSAVRTYDATTGKQVKLDQLLSPAQLNGLVKDIEARLPKLKGPEGVEGSTFHFGDTASLKDIVNENFAVTTDKNGKVQLQVAWESGVHALGGLTAHFTVDAPTDNAFRSKAGLE